MLTRYHSEPVESTPIDRTELYGGRHTIRLSKIQRVILGLLTGSERGLVFRTGGSLTTGELLEELQARGLMTPQWRKIGMFTVRRAALALYHRGLISAHYVSDCDHPRNQTVSFSRKSRGEENRTAT